MGLFNRKGGNNDDTDCSTTVEEPPLPEIDAMVTEQAQELMLNHLDIMKDIVMKIRHEDGFAKNMYKNCPRLQYLLEQNPDLRPVFEDPRLVRINFETVYKEAGGVLPEEEEQAAIDKELAKNKKSWIMKIAKSPLFKIIKFAMFVKKFVGCIAGGGIAAVGGCIACATDCCTDCCCEDAVDEISIGDDSVDMDDDDELGGADGPQDPNAQALNQAAEYMEDPDVQEQMQRLLEDPDNLADAIENDSELRTLRDSNPLCAELMEDPDTMKILVDPDNLRALGEAPQLIELDFADPQGFVPEVDFFDIDGGGGMDGAQELGDGLDYILDDADFGDVDLETDYEAGTEGLDADVDADVDADADADAEGEGDDAEGEEEGEEGEDEEEEDDEGMDDEEGEEDGDDDDGGWEEDIELEEQELDADADGGDNADKGEAGKGKGKGGKSGDKKNSAAQDAAAKKGGMAGIIASVGVAATDVIASQIVGQVFGDALPFADLLSGGGDDGPDMAGMEDIADQAEEIGDGMEGVVNDDVADIAEDTMDEVNDGKDDLKDQAREGKEGGDGRENHEYDEMGRKINVAGAAVGGAGAGLALGGAAGTAAVVGGGGGTAQRRGSNFAAAATKTRSGSPIRGKSNNKNQIGNDDGSIDSFASANSDENQYDDDFDDEEDQKEKDGSSSDEDEDGKKKKKKGKKAKVKKGAKKGFGFGFDKFKEIAAATATGLKEEIATTFLGDDFGEMLVEKIEEDEEDEDDEEGSGDDKDKDKKKKKKDKKKKGDSDDGDDDDDVGSDDFDDEGDDEKPKSKSKKGSFFRRK